MIIFPSANTPQVYRQSFATTEYLSGDVRIGDEDPAHKNRVRDTVSLSNQGKELSAENQKSTQQTRVLSPLNSKDKEAQKNAAKAAQDNAITQQLKKRDTDVRTHELAHLAATGQYAAGGASYTYQTGPDGVKYAIGGEVPIDISPEKTPEATIHKMETVRKAALAPADPSSADLQIAAEASAQEILAMQELQTVRREKVQTGSLPTQTGSSSNQDIVESRKVGHQSATDIGVSSRIASEGSRHMMITTYQAMNSIA
jgi:hypothetical protein